MDGQYICTFIGRAAGRLSWKKLPLPETKDMQLLSGKKIFRLKAAFRLFGSAGPICEVRLNQRRKIAENLGGGGGYHYLHASAIYFRIEAIILKSSILAILWRSFYYFKSFTSYYETYDLEHVYLEK